MGTLVEIIPGGYTSKLQVMDVGLNRPFKKIFNESGDKHIQRSVEYQIPGAKVSIRRQDISGWVKHAWYELRKDTIEKTWAHVGIRDESEKGKEMRAALMGD